MGVAALLSLLAFAHSFEWTAGLVQSLSRTDGGYRLYLLGSAAIAMAVMLPAAFFAGTTLPLFTLALLRSGAGETAIGRLYAANTIGAIAGVVLTVHVLVPLAGVRMAIVLAAAGDVLLGFWLLAHGRGEVAPRRVADSHWWPRAPWSWAWSGAGRIHGRSCPACSAPASPASTLHCRCRSCATARPPP